ISPGWENETTLSSYMAYPSFLEIGDLNIARIRRLYITPSPRFGYSSTRVGMTACFPRAAMDRPDFEQRAHHYYARLDTAIEEDIPALARQHRGLNSPYARPGRFSSLEPSVAEFAFWYARAMTA
ncbi:MAG: hypothetical protein GY791_05560, partial [Alphaproteobacteria bacterium]|nr:hypothetical protein [Alphaproteobacteria bacterium]